MAITIPSGCYRQPSEREAVDANGNKTFEYVLKGGYSALETLLHGLSKGDEIVSGWVMSSAILATAPGDTGVLTINCTPNDTTGAGTEQSPTVQKALDELWTLRSVRNDMSILAYCGGGNNQPVREWIEAWQKEPDGRLASQNSFTRADGSVFVIDVASPDSTVQNRATSTIDVIGKIRKGIDSVMRFYPMLTKTTTFSTPPATVYENLAYIDTPTVGTTATTEKLQKPGNLSTIISSHTWLKCQDDCAATADGKYQRIESWMGILSSNGGWDENLYGSGSTRWPMPYAHNTGTGST